MRAIPSLLVAVLGVVACSDSAVGPRPLIDRPLDAHAANITLWVPEILSLPSGHDIGEVHDINDSRLSVGWTEDYSANSPMPVRWSAGGTPSILTMPGTADGGRAHAINNVGQIVGWAKSSGVNQPARLGASPALLMPGFRGSAMDNNSAGAAVGYIHLSPSSNTTWPIHWSASGTPSFLKIPTGYFEAEATGISDNGTITGWAHSWYDSGDIIFEGHRAVMWSSPSATPVILGQSFGLSAPTVSISPDGIIMLAQDNGTSGFSQSFAPPYDVMLGSTTSIATRARNDRNRMVGHDPVTNLARTRRDGVSTNMAQPAGAVASTANGVNACGSAVGYFRLTTAINAPLPVRWERSGVCDAPF